jgi:hypothetical protein
MVLDAEEAERFLVARDGDSLVCPFQCDVCHFVNVMGREPLVQSATDTRMLKCIRRVMLDAFWAREPTTVGHVLQEAKTGLAISTQLGFAHKLFGPRGPFPAQDVDGMAAAIVMVQRSLAKGRYGATVKFKTVRKFRAVVSNIYHSSIEGQGATVMAKDTRKLQVTKCPTYTAFFERFCHGMHKRMGDIVRPERALSHDILRAIMEELDRDWERRHHAWIDVHGKGEKGKESNALMLKERKVREETIFVALPEEIRRPTYLCVSRITLQIIF